MKATSQITVRNVDADLKARLQQQARHKHTSVNGLMLDIARKAVGSDQSATVWRKYAGAIPAGGINEKALADFEKTDPTMWS